MKDPKFDPERFAPRPGRTSAPRWGLTLRHTRTLALAIMLVLFCALGTAVSAKTVYVNQNAVVGTNDGTTWNNACLTITEGIAASSDGDELWIAAGTYLESVTLTGGVTYYGGFDGTESSRSQRNWKTNPTIIDGPPGSTVVALMGSWSLFDGFTVTGGDTGIQVWIGILTIKNCAIANMSRGVYVDVSGTASVVGCILKDNWTGVSVMNQPSSASIGESLVTGSNDGVLVEERGLASVINCTLNGNAHGVNAVNAGMFGQVEINNCIVANNQNGFITDQGTVTGRHNDFWNNSVANYPAGFTFDEHSITLDPKFKDAPGGDFHLLSTSPCIDAGDKTSYIGETDLDGLPRNEGANVDMGAYESHLHVPAVIRVDASSLGSIDGTTWGTAFRSVSPAIAAAQSGDEIWVAAGTYNESNTLPANVALYGGFAGTETARSQRNWTANPVVLTSGSIGITVISSGSGALLDGFIFTSSLIGVYVNEGALTIQNCVLNDNSTGVECGNNTVARVANCTISGGGNGVDANFGGAATVVNCTITGTNAAINLESSGVASVSNCILTFNGNAFAGQPTNTVTLSHNDVSNSTVGNYPYWLTPDTNSISEDPLFVNSAGGDYHLLPTSPCIDVGDDTANIGTTDLDDKVRKVGTHVDMGAYEGLAAHNTVVYFVDAHAWFGNRSGTSWANACVTVTDGLAVAGDGDEIWVAASTYNEQIVITKGVALYGGFAGGDPMYGASGNETLRSDRNLKLYTATLDQSTGAATVTSYGSGARLDGFNLVNATGSEAVIVTGGALTVANCSMGNNRTGVRAMNNTNATVANCTISGGDDGVYANSGSTVSVVNCDISHVQNSGVYLEANSIATVANCILGMNQFGLSMQPSASLTVSHNDLWQNWIGDYPNGFDPGLDSIYVDPLYAAAGDGFHLQATSPCKDAGSDAAAVETTDKEGNPRVSGVHIDIGAYEVQPHIPVVIYVNSMTWGDGSSWNSAFHTVCQGLNAAQSGDQVWVAYGEYMEDITIPGGVALYGGFSGTETTLAERNWQDHPVGLIGQFSDTVVTASGSGSVIDGFTIANAGDGVSVSGGAMTIANCYFSNDRHGLSVSGTGVATVQKCRFDTGDYGVSAMSGGTAVISNSIISHEGYGVYTDSGTVTAVNCDIINNGMGVGVGVDNGGTATVSNCIIANVSVSFNKSSGTLNVSHNDVWNNIGGALSFGYTPDLDSIIGDPKFKNLSNGDYQLLGASPCIGAGDDSLVTQGETDMDGNARLQGAHVDIGAYENTPHVPSTIYVNSLTWGDGSSWNNACHTIGQALNIAQSGDQVWVAAGTYNEQLTLGGGIALYGGFAGTESDPAQRPVKDHLTTLDGQNWSTPVTSSGTGGLLDGFNLVNALYANAVYVNGGTLAIQNCALKNNQTGVRVANNGGATVADCTIWGGSNGFFDIYAGSGSTVSVVNCDITGAISGIHLEQDCTATVTNCIVAFNQSGFESQPGATWIVSNNVYWHNTNFNYPNGITPGTGNVIADPKFTVFDEFNSWTIDFRLQSGSPCIDAGDDNAGIGTTDLDGNARVAGAHVDMGAYENTPYIPAIIHVNQNASGGNGTSWLDAYRTVTEGIAAAQSGDEVWVAKGQYYGGITIPAGVSVYGGFAGTEGARSQRNWAANATILDGQGGGTLATLSGCTLDGFTLTNTYTAIQVMDAPVTVANCTISSSSVHTGISVAAGPTTVQACQVSNVAIGVGVSIMSGGAASVQNCVLANNVAGVTVYQGTADITNCTIPASGQTGIDVAGGTATVSNCIVTSGWVGISVSGGTATLSHNDVWGNTNVNIQGVSPDAYSIIADPMFVNSAGGDLHLMAASPCIDGGDDSAFVGATDLDGNPRTSGANVDMGAYESFPYEFATYPARTLTSPTASVNRVVYFGDSAGYIHAIDAATRIAVFNVDIKGAIGGASANPNRQALGRLTRWNLDGTPMIFCVSSDNYLMVFDLAGNPVWTTPLGGSGTSVSSSAMAFKDGSTDFIYVATSNGANTTVSKVDRFGNLTAQQQVSGSSTSTVSVFGGSVFFSTPAGSYRLQASDLTVRNSYAAGVAPPFIAATERSPIAIVVTNAGTVNAYSTSTGFNITAFGSSGSVDLQIGGSNPKVSSAPFVYGDKVYVGGMDNKVYCVNLWDGTPAGPASSKVFFDAAVGGGGSITGGIGVCPYGAKTLVFGSTNGSFYSVNLANPAIYAAINIGSPINSAPAYDPVTQTTSIAADNGSMYQMPATQ